MRILATQAPNSCLPKSLNISELLTHLHLHLVGQTGIDGFCFQKGVAAPHINQRPQVGRSSNCFWSMAKLLFVCNRSCRFCPLNDGEIWWDGGVLPSGQQQQQQQHQHHFDLLQQNPTLVGMKHILLFGTFRCDLQIPSTLSYPHWAIIPCRLCIYNIYIIFIYTVYYSIQYRMVKNKW